jgi:TatD DNase family protein
MVVDTHAHLNFNAFENDADEVIRRSLNSGLFVINVGSQYDTSKRAVEMAEKYGKGVYAAIGLHPIHAEDGFDYEIYKELAGRAVAIGEIGLDYKKEYLPFREKQKEILLKQMELAQELNLPIIFHCRMAHDELIGIISSFKFTVQKPGVVHCFTGSWQKAQKYMDLGFYLGFNGIIFKMDLDEVIAKAPLDKILLETDCPYLTPPPMTGRNEPLYVKYVAERVAKIKNLSYKEIAQITTTNTERLFKIQ